MKTELNDNMRTVHEVMSVYMEMRISTRTFIWM
jgi:hypothetical protein